jgi:protein-L-isoaspartate(D-aspartate) O-methyltransferase
MKPPPARFPARLGSPPDKPARKADAATLRPQRPLHDAARSASASASVRPQPAGLGLDSDSVRRRMVEMLRRRGLRSERVIQAMLDVPRHLFVDSALANQAYEDTSLPIGHGQTISKPSVVARMLALLFERRAAHEAKLGRVLEIGTGCGYQAALLARLAVRVISIERLRPLHDKARDNLASLPERQNLRLVYGDGRHGHAPNAPYDAIVCAAGGDDIPQAWLDQLAVGGRLVAPMRADAQGAQVLVSVDRHETGWSRRHHEGVRFVPLRSGTG